jgi:hypothetical protein
MTAKPKANKESLHITLSKSTKRKAEEYGNSEEYGSASNFAESSFLYYMGALNKEREIELETRIKELEAERKASNKELDLCKIEIERLRKANERHTAMILKLLNKYPELVNDMNELERQFRI